MRCRHGASLGDGREWAVVRTHPSKERLAEEHLARQQFEIYCPRVVKRVRKLRCHQKVIRPLFPGYLFVRVAPERQHWRPILSTFGVQTLICFGERPGLLDNAFIACLKDREVEGLIVRSAPVGGSVEPYRPGDRVQVNGGPFDGAVATILALREKDRLVVLMDLLQRGVRATVSVDQVVPASDRRAA